MRVSVEGQGKKVHISTLGCRQNQFDSDALEAAAVEAGYALAADPSDADLHIVNTCAITHEADRDSRRAVKRALQRNPGAKVVATGCYVNAEPEFFRNLDGLLAAVGNEDKAGILPMLHGRSEGRSEGRTPRPSLPVIQVDPERLLAGDTEPQDWLRPSVDPQRSRAYLKVQDGCDYKCSFCIVPSVRGPSRSLPLEHLVEEFRRLKDHGHHEVNLTGVHLGTYGRDLGEGVDLATLLGRLLPIAGETKLRLGSLDPHEVSGALIQCFEDYPDNLCPHLHLPVQSVDSEILKRMRRAHRASDFWETVERVHSRVPHLSIGTDVIVGFPGESDAHFARTREALSALPIAYMHVFTYSVRRGTSAAAYGDQIPKQEKRARNRELRLLSEMKNREHIQRSLGTSRPVLGLRDGTGLSDNYIRVELDRPHRGWRNYRLGMEGAPGEEASRAMPLGATV